jgi:hypothetical protein
MTFAEALATMLAVPQGGEGVVEWLQRLPRVDSEPPRRRLLGRSTPVSVTLGKWRITPAGRGLTLQLISGDITVRTRQETGTAAAALVADLVDQHAATLTPLERDQLEAEVSALREIAAGSAPA